MRRSVPDYGVQGPDALFLHAVLLSSGVFGLALLRSFRYFFVFLTLVGGAGVFILLVVSSYSYRTALRDHILELHPLVDSPAVLDIGTGRGLLAIGFAKSGCYAVGVDIWASRDLLRNHPLHFLLNARLEGVEVPLLTADCLRLPLREGSFDVVVCCDTIHNIHRGQRMRKALSEMQGVLREKGKVIIADLNPFLGPGWAKGWWIEELRKAGFQKISLRRFRLTAVLSAEKCVVSGRQLKEKSRVNRKVRNTKSV